MQIGGNVYIERSAKLAWKRLPDQDQNELSIMLAQMVGGRSGTIDEGSFKIFYELSEDGQTVTIVSVETECEADILRR